MNRPADGVDQSQRIAGSAQLEMHAAQAGKILGVRHIRDGRSFALLDRVVERRLGHTDYFNIGKLVRTAESDPAPNRTLAGEKLLCELLRHHGNPGRGHVALIQASAQKNRDLHRRQE